MWYKISIYFRRIKKGGNIGGGTDGRGGEKYMEVSIVKE